MQDDESLRREWFGILGKGMLMTNVCLCILYIMWDEALNAKWQVYMWKMFCVKFGELRFTKGISRKGFLKTSPSLLDLRFKVYKREG